MKKENKEVIIFILYLLGFFLAVVDSDEVTFTFFIIEKFIAFGILWIAYCLNKYWLDKEKNRVNQTPN